MDFNNSQNNIKTRTQSQNLETLKNINKMLLLFSEVDNNNSNGVGNDNTSLQTKIQ